MRLESLGLLCLAALVVVAVPALGLRVDPQPMVDRAGVAVQTVASDPQAAVSNPDEVARILLGPSDNGGDEPGAPVEERHPGFADRVREAFGTPTMMAGASALVLSMLGAGSFALVTRYISPKEALKNPQRAMLYGFVRGNPGVHLKKLSEEFAMKTSSILWHIRKLESAELVRSERANGFRVFYPVDGGIEIKRVSRAITALQNRNARALFELLDRRSGQSPAQMAARLSIHAGTVRWHLRKLRDFGLVDELVREDGATYYAAPLGRKALRTMEGTPVAEVPMSSPLASALPLAEA